MYKVVTFLFAGALICGLGAESRFRGSKAPRPGKSNVDHLLLCEKDPATWECVEDCAWGKMMYNLTGPEFRYVFNGHWLEPETMYTLVYYPDPWPGENLMCLGEGTSDEDGDVHIQAKVETCDLPAPYDDNYHDGAKIWLVLSSDVDCVGDELTAPQMIAWNPTEYLFEYNLISFDDTNSMWDDMGVCVDAEE